MSEHPDIEFHINAEATAVIDALWGEGFAATIAADLTDRLRTDPTLADRLREGHYDPEDDT